MLLKKFTKAEKKGVGLGAVSPLLYAIDSVLDILLFAVVFYEGYRDNLELWQTICYAFITSFVKDFFLFVFMEIKTKGKVIRTFVKIHKEKKRAFWWTILGSLCGGPLGFTLTTATILYSGAAYGAALANFSPVLVLLFSRQFFKTRFSKLSWLGVFLAVGGFLGLSFYSSFTTGESFGFDLRTFIGVILAVLAVLTWSTETIIAEFTEKFGPKASLTNDEKLCIKSTISSSSVLVVFLPLSMLFAFVANQWDVTWTMMTNIFVSYQAWVILGAIGTVVVGGRYLYWYAIASIGGGRADILYYLTVLFTPLLVVVLTVLQVPGFANPEGVDKLWYWVLLFTQMIGVGLITFFSKNNKEHIYQK